MKSLASELGLRSMPAFILTMWVVLQLNDCLILEQIYLFQQYVMEQFVLLN